jgi:tRNA (mo5U34)-methyltransferase
MVFRTSACSLDPRCDHERSRRAASLTSPVQVESTLGAMAVRSLRWRGFGLTVEVPDRIAARLRSRSRADNGPRQMLTLADPPSLHIEKHSPEHALKFFYNPDHRPEATGLDPADFRLPLDIARKLTNDPVEAAHIATVVWYHTIELPNGVVTPGEYDHRPLLPHYGLPADLTGQRALDIGTNNGFWAFELERRGASVVAVDVGSISELDHPPGAREVIEAKDIDIPIGEGFAVAHKLLRSNVEKVISNIYALDPATIGTFDFVHIADVLLHLREPLRALERVRSVTSGRALIVDSFEPDERPGHTWYTGGWNGLVWWRPSLETLAQMVLDAGFSSVRLERVFNLSHARGAGLWRAVLLAEP